MAKHLLTNMIAAGGLAVAVAATGAGDARAFTETAVTPPAGQTAAGKQAAPAVAPELQLQKPVDGKGIALTMPGEANSGTELRIPGVGSIGKLPKLDFGLELLYGGNNDPATEKRDENDGDVQIKGSIKHRF
jgi:hypothetical protein